MILHGVRDTIIPYRMGRQLFDAAPATSSNGIPKEFVDLPHADHNDVVEMDGAVLSEAVKTFLARVCSGR